MYNCLTHERETQMKRNTSILTCVSCVVKEIQIPGCPGRGRAQRGDKSNEMTLLECKLAFFTIVAAPARAHETSLPHTRAVQAKALCETFISNTHTHTHTHTSRWWECEGTFVGLLKSGHSSQSFSFSRPRSDFFLSLCPLEHSETSEEF